MENNSVQSFLKKNFFYVGVGVLTVMMVIIFRQNNLDKIFEEGKKGIASFYTANLKPMIYTNEITNEDVFNFAMFNSLPINKKENKMLFIDQDEQGKNSISIHTSEYKENTGNYKQFLEYLGAALSDRKKFDSLIAYHKAKLYTAILANGNNTIAVNQNIAFLHNIMYADIMMLAQKINFEKANQIYAGSREKINPVEMQKMDEALWRNDEPQNYFLVNNDSIYTVKMAADIPRVTISIGNPEDRWRDEFNNARVRAEGEMVRNVEKNKELFDKYAPSRYNRDMRVSIPDWRPPQGYEKTIMKLNNLPKLSKMVTFELDEGKGKSQELAFKMNFDISKLDSFLVNTVDAVMAFVPPEERGKVKKEIDSAFAAARSYKKSLVYEKNKAAVKENMKKNISADTNKNKQK